MEVREQGDHADEAGDGEDVYRGGGFLFDVYTALGDVVGYREGLVGE